MSVMGGTAETVVRIDDPPLSAERVRFIYSFSRGEKTGRMDIPFAISLCESHERLRHDLENAERLLDSGANKLVRLEATIKQQQREIMELRTELERERMR